jgi:hypothetical protein
VLRVVPLSEAREPMADLRSAGTLAATAGHTAEPGQDAWPTGARRRRTTPRSRRW